jgi:hypothetical protein
VETVNRPADHMLARKLLAQQIAVTPQQAADPNFDLKTLVPKPPMYRPKPGSRSPSTRRRRRAI